MISRSSFKGVLLAAVALPLGSVGCEHHHHDHERVAVREEIVYSDVAPPTDRVEVISARPSEDHIWVKGHYIWRGGRYEWVSGHWMLAPRRGAEWVAGHWDREGRRYFWVEGHWR